jgi:ribosomal protein S18 acetylase RimI-like enzyme
VEIMVVLERITSANALVFREVRLRALRESPSAFGSTFARESQISDADWIKRADQWTSQRSVGYLAMSSDEPCGIAATFLDENDQYKAHLVSMWVDPARRRSGIGHTLIETIRAWAAENGARSLHLTVTSSNSTAIEFYERNGFVPTGKTLPYPNDPKLFEYEMTCPIG